MGKTQAEIQKQYRKRKKLREGGDYLKNGRQRVKPYYKPVAVKNSTEKKTFRQKNRDKAEKQRKMAPLAVEGIKFIYFNEMQYYHN